MSERASSTRASAQAIQEALIEAAASLRKSEGIDDARRAIERAARHVVSLLRVTDAPAVSAPALPARPLIGESPVWKLMLQHARLVAKTDATVLITGETGTGKELLARFVHENSVRARGPLVAVNCAALPDALVESELFGYERGALAGASADTPGKFELADGGTVFLDEIGDLPAIAQAKLLRVLQDGVVYRLGATRSRLVRVRVVAATNRDLAGELGRGRFRPDLYYRLAAFPIALPPLRERREDIGPLAATFVKQFASLYGKRIEGIAPVALEALRAYMWPGNVRQLQNAVERAVVLTSGRRIALDVLALPAESPAPAAGRAIVAEKGSDQQTESSGVRPHVISLAEAERTAIINALTATRWRLSGPHGAARLLDIKPTTLYSRMRKLDIRRPRERRQGR